MQEAAAFLIVLESGGAVPDLRDETFETDDRIERFGSGCCVDRKALAGLSQSTDFWILPTEIWIPAIEIMTLTWLMAMRQNAAAESGAALGVRVVRRLDKKLDLFS